MHAPTAAPARSDRVVTLDLTPAMGVRLAVDGAGERNIQTGDSFTLDSKSHLLAFSCPVCTTVERQLAAGDKDEHLRVTVPIRPATLVIDGPLDRSYEVAENPLLNIHVGSNNVPIDGQFESVTVVQLETHTRVTVRLESGKAVHAAF